MKITLMQVNHMSEILNKFAEQKLNFKLSYKIMKIMSQFEDEIQFYQDSLKKLIDECSLKDKEGNVIFSEDKQNIKLQEGKSEDFNKQYQELMETEIELNEKYQLTLEELEALELTPIEVFKIQPIIKE